MRSPSAPTSVLGAPMEQDGGAPVSEVTEAALAALDEMEFGVASLDEDAEMSASGDDADGSGDSEEDEQARALRVQRTQMRRQRRAARIQQRRADAQVHANKRHRAGSGNEGTDDDGLADDSDDSDGAAVDDEAEDENSMEPITDGTSDGEARVQARWPPAGTAAGDAMADAEDAPAMSDDMDAADYLRSPGGASTPSPRRRIAQARRHSAFPPVRLTPPSPRDLGVRMERRMSLTDSTAPLLNRITQIQDEAKWSGPENEQKEVTPNVIRAINNERIDPDPATTAREMPLRMRSDSSGSISARSRSPSPSLTLSPAHSPRSSYPTSVRLKRRLSDDRVEVTKRDRASSMPPVAHHADNSLSPPPPPSPRSRSMLHQVHPPPLFDGGSSVLGGGARLSGSAAASPIRQRNNSGTFGASSSSSSSTGSGGGNVGGGAASDNGGDDAMR